MPVARSRWWIAASTAFALVVAVFVDRAAPPPAADVSRGGEDAFASGLHRRELPPGGRPQRWTEERARLRFRDVPKGAAVLEVRLRGHRGTVAVTADGVTVGVMPPGTTRLEAVLPPARAATREVELLAEPFVAGDGRRLGALLERVEVRHGRRALPSPRLLLLFALPAAVVAAGAVGSGLVPAGAALAAAVACVFQAALLWPSGLVRSDYAPVLAALLMAGAALAVGFARWCERWSAGSGRWAFPPILLAVAVQGILATSPLMVVSDAVFHANNLARVASGEWFLTSVTQHARPFRFPYGVSFYAILAPPWHAGLDSVLVVRGGAALAGVMASAALFWLALPLGAPMAALATASWQLLPGTVDAFSYGNLSNVFGQSLTVSFFAWWLRGRRFWTGALLLAVGCLAHFSSLVTLGALAVCLVAAERGREGAGNRLAGVAVGLGLTVAYYVRFLPLILEQLPRLGEAGGGMAGGFAAGAWRQVEAVSGQWGLPALALATAGLAYRWPEREGRALLAYGTSGLVLLVAALLSPLEVRYLYALGPALALAAAAGFLGLWGRGVAARAVAVVLWGTQAYLAGGNAVEALLARYRP